MTQQQFNELVSNQVLNDLYYPSAKNWMWDYCLSMGKFTDSSGRNYDLGVHLNSEPLQSIAEFSNATVFEDNEGAYSSAMFDMEALVFYNGEYISKLEWYKIHNFEAVIECWNRLQNLLLTIKQ